MNDVNHIKKKVVSDSPELCRGLDSHGFVDKQRAVSLLTELAVRCQRPPAIQDGHTNEFERCWEVEPTSEHIIEDIVAFR